MGYTLTSVFSVSPDDEHEWFVYFVPDRNPYFKFETAWINTWIYDNFSKIAQNIGPCGVIIAPSNAERNSFCEDIYDTLPSDIPQAFSDGTFQGGDKLFHEPFPFLLVTQTPISKSEIRKSFFFNLVKFQDEKELCRFFDCLTESILKGDIDYLVERFPMQEPASRPDGYGGIIGKNNDIFHLKPNIFGVGINLNAVLDKLSERLKTGNK